MKVKLRIIGLFFLLCLICIPTKVLGAENSIVTYKLGDNVTGTLAVDGTLTVSGTGEMYDFDCSGENISPLRGN